MEKSSAVEKSLLPQPLTGSAFNMTNQHKTDNLRNSLTEALSKAVHTPISFQDSSEQLKAIVAIIRNKLPAKVTQLFKDMSDSELIDEIASFLTYYQAHTKEKSEDKFINELAQCLESLTKVKSYKAFLFIPKIFGFPAGESFGLIKTITRKEVTFDHDEGFWEHFEFIKTKYADVDADNGLWLECTFNSVLIYNLRDELKKSIQPFLGIISILMFGFPLTDESLIGVILGDKSQEYVAPDIIGKNHLTKGWASYHPANNQNVEKVKKVFAKQKNSELERKLILSSKMYWLALQSYSPEITFISLISALESLLLGEGDRDYIGLKIAEKVAFLLSDEQEQRLQIFKLMRKYYNTRSSLVHGKSGKSVRVAAADLGTIKNIFTAVFEKALNLVEQYPRLHTEDEKGLDDYINQLRFK